MPASSARSRKITAQSRRYAALLACFLLILLALTLGACGSDKAATTTTAADTAGEGAQTTTAAAETPAAMSAEELGTKIGAVYVDALEKATAALAGSPEVAAAKSQVEQLKAEYVEKLVALGALREAMSAADRATVDSKIVSALDAAGREDWYAQYNTAWKEYSAQDTELGNMIAGFNVLGQYANYDLLKQQLPDEAARLGID